MPLSPVVRVAVAVLAPGGSPRLSGTDPAHVEVLAETPDDLPPIIVHRATMRVIDGAHRLAAARRRGAETIAAVFFEGTEAEAFVLAVRANAEHGLPLSLSERKHAAERIIAWHPRWSNRRVAATAGLSPSTVAAVRRRMPPAVTGESSRVGRDGRVRPLDGAERRRAVADLLRENPDLSLRRIALAAGVSPETVRAVRNRMFGPDEPPTRPDTRHEPSRRDPAPDPSPDASPEPRMDVPLARLAGRDPVAVLRRLAADPALRFSETGRELLRLLHIQMIREEEWDRIIEEIPAHSSGLIAQLARERARMWVEFAAQIQRGFGAPHDPGNTPED
ncbi:ParB N-terminal domain-containing protein [Actinomadura rayongensis]|uniref:ParB N-terminal domain-containing protein n=2 Tax=Actinomadura rayongensis TaxID=1429076 RepID=A0A6I4VYL0_9ACTN|nr:ParB N-terminal domain-containing protein [Actinomadura rayongensis]MXQ63057.1 ParB N-terminal domain-containing protein [Actinomadura rayongensis]